VLSLRKVHLKAVIPLLYEAFHYFGLPRTQPEALNQIVEDRQPTIMICKAESQCPKALQKRNLTLLLRQVAQSAAVSSEMMNMPVIEWDSLLTKRLNRKETGMKKQTTPTQTVYVEALEHSSFAAFGVYSRFNQPSGVFIGASPIRFFRDLLPLELGGKNPMLSICRVEPRAKVIDVMEYHTMTGEGILPLDGDVLVQVAPATPPGLPFPAAMVRVFHVPQGTMLCIRPGVWHHAPFVLGNQPVNVLIVLPERTYANDCLAHEIPTDQLLRISYRDEAGQ
jgi:ureidoglycolate lyase